MDIVRVVVEDGIDLTIQGRLDSYWAEHLDRSIAETVREGHDRLRLDLSRVTFLSSAGIAVLMKYSKQLRAIDGELVVFSPSAQVRTVLDMTRLTVHLVEAPDRTAARAAKQQESVAVEREGARLELFDLVPGAVLRGDAVLGEDSAASLRCPDSLFGLGVGAIGASGGECRDRFGEFLALAGAAVYLPGDGTHVPDYLVAAGNEAPEVQVLHGLTGVGEFARLLRFDPADAGAVRVSDLATWCLELSGGSVAGLAIVAEAAGLVGAALRHSSAVTTGGADLFAYPAVRNHLSFTAERAFVRTTAVVTGFVAHDPRPELRPLGGPGSVYGHFHAAAFSFAPLKKGRLALKPLIAHVFEHQSLLGVLHLLNDDRPAGAGQSELVRGACWFGPLQWGS
jgi:anti-anti-sigma factor